MDIQYKINRIRKEMNILEKLQHPNKINQKSDTSSNESGDKSYHNKKIIVFHPKSKILSEEQGDHRNNNNLCVLSVSKLDTGESTEMSVFKFDRHSPIRSLILIRHKVMKSQPTCDENIKSSPNIIVHRKVKSSLHRPKIDAKKIAKEDIEKLKDICKTPDARENNKIKLQQVDKNIECSVGEVMRRLKMRLLVIAFKIMKKTLKVRSRITIISKVLRNSSDEVCERKISKIVEQIIASYHLKKAKKYSVLFNSTKNTPKIRRSDDLLSFKAIMQFKKNTNPSAVLSRRTRNMSEDYTENALGARASIKLPSIK